MEAPAYTPYIQHDRTRAIEAVLSASAEILEVPSVARRLGRYAAALTTIINRATIPNIHNGEIILDGCRSDSIPIVAVHIGEPLMRRSKDLTFNPSQRYVINRTYKSGVARDIYKYQQRHYHSGPTLVEVPALEADRTVARVHVDHLENDDGGWPMRLYSRPLVQFNLDAGQPLSPIVALHEFTHVIQLNSKPIERARNSHLPKELEAYYVAAEAIMGYQDVNRQDELLRHTSQDNLDTAIEVESIRRQHNGLTTDPQPFAYSRELAAELAMEHLAITPAIAALIDSHSRSNA